MDHIDEELRHYLELTTDYAFALNSDLVITKCFQNREIHDGPRPEELIGRYFYDLVPGEYRDKLIGLFANSRLEEKGKFHVTYIDDEGHHVDISAISRWEKGTFIQYKVLLRDRTRRINRGWIRANFSSDIFYDKKPTSKNSSYWESQALQYELLAAVSLAFAGSGPFDVTMRKALKLIGTYQDADRCVITHIDHERMVQSCIYEWHSEHTHSAIATKQNEGFDKDNPFHHLLATSPYVGVANTSRMQDDTRFQFVIEDEKAFIHFPIFIDNVLFGSFGVDYCREAHDWSESEITMFQTIVNCISSAIKRNLAEEKLKQNNAMLEGILRNYPGVIWYCDAQFTCSLIDGGDMDVLGLRQEAFLNKNILEALEEQGLAPVASMLRETVEHGSKRLNFEKDGRYLSMTTTLLQDEKGEPSGIVGVCLDITDIRQVQERLQEAMDDAEKASKAKSEFLSRMSHEIRTPMNAIIGMNTIAKKTSDISKIQYCLGKIGLASNQLLGIINDVLDIAKIEANKFELSETEFDFEKMLQNICNVIDVQISEKKQNFIVDFSDLYDRYVISDELRLSQVMINLLSNAVKFTPEGGTIILRVRYHPKGEDSGVFQVDVCDNGIGVSGEQQSRLFSSFEQADSSITRKYGGTGLGLSICKSIVALMGGDITLTSQPGIGSQFSFSVNVRWGAVREEVPAVLHEPLGAVSILVIDDSRDVLEYFENILQAYSLNCDTAPNGLQGIVRVQEAAEAGKPYDLVFVDWMMPGMDGMETAKMIKEIAGPETVVIMISVADWSEITKGADAIGVDRFLSKPVLPSTLFNSILEWTSPVRLTEVKNPVLPVRDWSDKTMLLVDDIEINREIIASMLLDTGLAIDFAEDGKKGLACFLQNPDRYDVVLMDVQMPEMDGFEATRSIRESGGAGGNVPIIAMTANAFTEDVERCLASGMNDHIAKPVDMNDLFTKVAAYLG